MMFTKRITTILAAMMLALTLRAQVPQEVQQVLDKAEAWTDQEKGYTMTVAYSILTIDLQMDILGKGSCFVTRITSSKNEGQVVEAGFNGTQQWLHNTSDNTLTISPATKPDKTANLTNTTGYGKGKMKQKDGLYEITLTKPKDKDMPSKMVIRVNAKTYAPVSYTVKSGITSMTLKVLRIKQGLDDSEVCYDPTERFKGATVKHQD